MSIKQIKGSILLYYEQNSFLNSIKPWKGTYWEKHSTRGNKKKIEEIKKHIHGALKDLQGMECAYCGLTLGETSNEEIEHIAPKGTLRNGTVLHPEFTFEPKNLVFACHLCNGFSKKGTFDTIEVKSNAYNNCQFKIVHPYFDNPSDHYVFTANYVKILIQHKTNKGKSSIDLFDLNGPAQTEARAKNNNLDQYKNFSKPTQFLVNLIMKRRIF